MQKIHVKNEETTDHPDIFVCRGLRQPWPELWKHFQWFGSSGREKPIHDLGLT